MNDFGPHDRVSNAIGFAEDTFARCGLDDVYFHSLSVKDNVTKLGDIIETVAVLHDIVEDTPVTVDEVRAAFGDTVANAVETLTRREHEPYHTDYLDRVKTNPIAWLVKAKGDLPHNLSRPRVEGWTEERMAGLRTRYTRAAKKLSF